MSGVATTALGLTGAYSLTNQQVGSKSVYSTTGLSFGDNFLSTSGGSLSIAAVGTNAYSLLTANLAVTTTGALYSSFLFNCVSLEGTAASAGIKQRVGSDHLITEIDSSAALLKPGIGYDSTTVASSGGNTLSLDTTYLALSRFTNVGLAGGGTADLFVFTLSGYNDWLTAGEGLESNLAAYATFKATDTTAAIQSFSGTIVFGATTGGASTGNYSAYVDELRYGTALSDVIATTVVPEPSSWALAIGGLGLLGFFRRKIGK